MGVMKRDGTTVRAICRVSALWASHRARARARGGVNGVRTMVCVAWRVRATTTVMHMAVATAKALCGDWAMAQADLSVARGEGYN